MGNRILPPKFGQNGPICVFRLESSKIKIKIKFKHFFKKNILLYRFKIFIFINMGWICLDKFTGMNNYQVFTNYIN